MTTHAVLKKIESLLGESSELRMRGGLEAEAREIARVWQERHSGEGNWPFQIARRRAAGEVLQYLLGVQYFYEHEYEVSPGVLVPRPETEILVDEGIRFGKNSRSELGFEFGVGSGIVSIEFLAHFPALQMVGVEVSEVARSIASKNASRILREGASRLILLDGVLENPMRPLREWVLASGRRADFLVSNPPYLLRDSCEIDADVWAHEPASALFAQASDGLDYYRYIVESAQSLLTTEGWIAVEIAHERARATCAVFEDAGWVVSLKDDLSGRPRVLMANRA